MAFLPTPSLASQRRHPRSASRRTVCATSTSPPKNAETTDGSQTDIPSWAGSGPLSLLVNALIATPPLYSVMKLAARATLINTAEKTGIPWRERVATLSASMPSDSRDETLALIDDGSVELPSYYVAPFHAYSEGNLGWLPAFEAEVATQCMAVRTFPEQDARSAFDLMRGEHFDAVMRHASEELLSRSDWRVLDAGCGVGMSTRDIARRLAKRGTSVQEVVGLDASPYFVAVAKMKESAELQPGMEWADVEGVVSFRHGLAEETTLENASVDWVSLQLVSHELPTLASRAVFQEAFRVLKPGGVFSLFDNDPSSPIIQNLPPVLFTLMKSTEPYSDQYYKLDIEGELRDAGFVNVCRERTDPRHRTIVATKQ